MKKVVMEIESKKITGVGGFTAMRLRGKPKLCGIRNKEIMRRGVSGVMG